MTVIKWIVHIGPCLMKNFKSAFSQQLLKLPGLRVCPPGPGQSLLLGYYCRSFREIDESWSFFTALTWWDQAGQFSHQWFLAPVNENTTSISSPMENCHRFRRGGDRGTRPCRESRETLTKRSDHGDTRGLSTVCWRNPEIPLNPLWNSGSLESNQNTGAN